MIPLDVLLTFYRHLQRGIMARSEIAPLCIAKTNVLHQSPHDIFKIASKYTFLRLRQAKGRGRLPNIFLLDPTFLRLRKEQEASTILCDLALFVSIC